nr:AAA family ATPase [Nitratireductor aquibiodomus]
MLKQFQKDMGDGAGSYGSHWVNADRIPTGMFELDLALSGGFPRGKVSMIFGPESSNKTNIALLAIAQHQKLWPELTCVFVDLENEYNAPWAKSLGVDTDKLILLKPAYAEQAVDMVEAMLLADDVGLVVLDSLAALVGTAELDKSAEGETPGAAGRISGKLYRKTIAAFVEAEKRGRYPSLFYINQITYKIGVMFGNPETTPGGKKPWFQSAIVLRVYGNNIIDSKISKVMPVRKEVSFVIKKFKVPILAASGKFEMATQPHGGLEIGQCDDANTIKGYLESFGEWFAADKKGWSIFGEHYATQKAWKERFYSEPAYANKVRGHVIKTMMAGGEIDDDGGSDE